MEATLLQSKSTPSSNAIQVDLELANLITPLSREEFQRLELNLLTKGCRDPLLIWKGENIVLDGHNRLGLCRKHGLPFRQTLVDLPDRAAVREYIVALQLSRRNLTREAAAYLRGKRYAAEKHSLGGLRTNGEAPGQNDQLTTAERLAAEYKVGEATIRRDERFARAVDAIVANCGEEAKGLILSRDTGLTQGQVLKLSREKPKEQQKYLQRLKEEGKAPRRKRALGQRVTITLPAEPKPLVEKLVQQLDRDRAREVYKLLGACLKQRKA